MYYITKKKDEDIQFDESDYYDRLDCLGVDYVKNLTKQESQQPLGWLQETLLRLGAVISYGYDGKNIAYAFFFNKTEVIKQNYFRPKLEKLKEDVQNLTLPDVVKAAPILDFIMDNEYGDLIVLDGENLSLDDFIRHIEPGVTYYVHDQVILMH